MLYKIGEFATIVDTPIKTLRYYDEINLFKPIQIDLFTNYRYYKLEQIEDFKLIKQLQKLGFSLTEIKVNWNNFTEEVMIKKREELINQSNALQDNIKELDYLKSKIINGKINSRIKEQKERVKSIFN